MKRIFFQFTVVLLLTTVAIACKKEPVQGINLDKSLLVAVGETATLTPIFFPPNAHNKKVSWKSNNPDVATVDNGKVTGKTVGKTTIKVITEDGARTAQCLVTVIQPIEPEEMIWVEGGTFMMGCNDDDDECMDRELPRHEVTVSGFYISKYVVTQKEWIATMGYNQGYDGPFIGDNYPTHCISWNDTQKYIAILNEKTGKNYRLPTEAEWEYAARGGNKSKGYKYSGSNYADVVAWSNKNSNNIQAVGQLKPNELGIYDMSGNICEFCSDIYGEYTDDAQINPTGYGTNISQRVLHGGAWHLHPTFARNSFRTYTTTEDSRWCSGGFRLVHP